MHIPFRSLAVSNPSPADGPLVTSNSETLTVLHLASVYSTSGTVLSGAKAGYSPTGGVQVHMGALVRQLDRRGVAQVVLTSYKPGSDREQVQGERIVVRRFGIPVRRWRQMWAVPAACAAVAESKSADLIHVHPSADLAALPIALSVARFRRVPLVVTLHSSALHTMRAVSPRLSFLKAAGTPAEVIALRSADAIITLTDRTRDLVIGTGADPQRVHTVPQPYDQESFQGPFSDPFPKIPRPRIVFVGRFSPEKGVPVLVEALSRLRSPAHLLLIGDGRGRSGVQKAIDRFGLGERVTISGFVPHPTVASALANADVVALPSLFEEAGTVLVEAMALGIPVVASDTGGIRNVTGDGNCGLLVPPGDPAAMASALDRVLGDAGLADQLSSAGRLRCFRQDWDSTGDRILDIYRCVVRASHH
ncbi:glycosyltransferase family 4 protein [Streptomyces sp. NPDC091217]|uniref:glycosyltransferase family 4 protein n=1 Tax=Streptomyces sp. NPDC091217 TaxID=3365975 RepID=UPI00380DA9BA